MINSNSRLSLALCLTCAFASSSAGQVTFNLDAVATAPRTFPAEEAQAEGVKAFFYEGPSYHGRQTRVFAYYGVPEAKLEPGQRWPAMVLIHGGGGTAFDGWVKVWNARGYAAIAMDLCGCVPVGSYGKWKRHETGGPPGWDAGFQQLDEAVEDQWTYQAVSAVALGHSLIRSYPEVDANRIGMTGISWGGYLTCIVAGVDSRFKLAAPVYGCGYLGDNSVWLPAFQKLGPQKSQLWLKQWDPAAYLPKAAMPMLWVNGTNDFAYPMDSWQKSYRLPQAERTLCLRVRMPHGHGPAGENPEEIHVFANQVLRGGTPLPKIKAQGAGQEEVWASVTADTPLTKAEVCYTNDDGNWQDRKWESAPAEILRVDSDDSIRKVVAKVPPRATVVYLNLFDDRNCVVSSEHVVRERGVSSPATTRE